MPYVIDYCNETSRFCIRIESEPDFILGLEMAPTKREELLNNGKWIILSFAVWSIHDIRAINTAIEAVKSINGRVYLGVRPFDDTNEFSPWCPYEPRDVELDFQKSNESEQVNISIAAATGVSPIWLFIQNGVFVQIYLGHLTIEQLKAIVESSLIDTN